MPQNLFAACKTNGQLIAKRVRLDADVQQAVTALFSDQEADFRSGVTHEVAFDGRWKPDEDEFLTIETPAEAQIFEAAIQANALSVPDLDTGAFIDEGIKALFTGNTVNSATKVLVQRFTSHQVLERKFALLQQGNAFRRLTETAFTLDGALTCLIEGGKIKFKSQQKMRAIIDMSDLYREATEDELQEFSSHASLHVANVDEFIKSTSQIVRKYIHAVINDGTLNQHQPIDIQTAAARTGLVINVHDGKIVMPNSNLEIKELLRFLTEGRYLGPLTGQTYITNSQRRA